jgi:heme exporter protein D
MPDLGKYAFSVLGAYTSTLVLLALLVAVTWARARATRQRLARAEERRRG